MPNAKYQIFISSTYEDLKDEREQVIKACLEMGHIPVGMEMFSAADEEQWKIITRQIDESDYYVVIIAHRYGSTVDGTSYTEKEYDYAVLQGIPTLGFILDESASWPADRNDRSKSRLNAFKQKVRQKPVAFWVSKDDLHSKCAIALMKTFVTRPRPGWVRAPEVAGPEVAAELSRLSNENAKLREALAELNNTPDTSYLAQGEDNFTLSIEHIEDPSNRRDEVVSWNQIFRVVAKTIISDPDENSIWRAIFNAFFGVLYDSDKFDLNRKHFEAITTQFIALGLIRIEHVSFGNYGDIMPIWKLTEKGRNLYASLAAKRRT